MSEQSTDQDVIVEQTTDRNLVLSIEELRTYFHTQIGLVKAVDGVNFNLNKGGTLGLVGETGCGKSVTALSILRLVPRPGRIEGGKCNFYWDEDKVIDTVSLNPHGEKMRSIRGNEMGIVFQEPMTSLNPVYTIGQQIIESVEYNQNLDKKEAREQAIEMLEKVHMSAPEQRVDEYPHELSGGMRQRAMIAIALSCNPSLLFADEPTTALDVTIEAQILNLLEELKQEFRMSTVIITHDLGVVGETTDRMVVMYMGKVMERGSTEEIFYDPQHPYTKGLMNSIPRIGKKEELTAISGSVPSPYHLPNGCYFAPRCPEAMDVCGVEIPPTVQTGPGRYVQCWLYQDRGEDVERQGK